MLRFTIRRLLELIPVLLAVVTVTFFLIRLAPGGPFTAERNYPEDAIQRMNEFYGLDDPLPIQYLNYLACAIRGDLGPSIHNPTRTVNDIIAQNFPVSLELGLYAMVFALLFGLASGLSAALRHNQWWDHLVMPVAMTGICVPSFVIGPVLALVCGLHYGWFNVAGWEEPSDRVLPAITLGLGVAAYIARLSRGSMLEVLPQDYIRTARAKGLNEGQILIRHALKNAMIPVVSFLGPAAAGIITGSFVVETIFQIPGLGRMFVMSAFNRDYPLILGLVAFYAVIVVFFNLLVDLCIAWLNPRTRAHTVA